MGYPLRRVGWCEGRGRNLFPGLRHRVGQVWERELPLPGGESDTAEDGS